VRVAAGAIIAVALALALVWVFRVPFFEEPDENAHADYAFTLFTLHAPFRARDGRPGTDVHPLVRYLEDRSGFRTVRYNPDGRVPAGYGSARFYRAIDAGAPRVPATFLAHDGGRVPFIARQYAYLYYALDALTIGAAALVSGGSAAAEFFGARLFNVALLGLSLTMTYLTLCELGVGRPWRLGLLAAVGWFPLTTWVSAYVQPDNLAFTAVALIFYLSLRLRREENVLRAALWLGLALGLLALTKYQYFIAVALPVLADRTVRSAPQLRTASRRLAYLFLVCVPTVILVASSLVMRESESAHVAQTIGANGDPLAIAAQHGPAALAAYVSAEGVAFVSKTFSWGLPFVSYWGAISWTARQLQFGDAVATSLVYKALGTCSLFIFALVVARTIRVWVRLARVARRRLGAFWRLLFSDVIFNSYVLFIVVIGAIWVATQGLAGTQGRYWLPFILPAMLCATRYAVPPVRELRRLRRPFVTIGTCALLLYSVTGSFAALAALDDRFYRAPTALSPFEYNARITRLGAYDLYAPTDGVPRVAFGAATSVDGWAVDSRAGAPARRIDIVIDDRIRIRARVGAPRPDAVDRLNDDDLLDSGFVARLPPTLPAGAHTLRLDVYELDRAAPYPSRAIVSVIVESLPRRALRPRPQAPGAAADLDRAGTRDPESVAPLRARTAASASAMSAAQAGIARIVSSAALSWKLAPIRTFQLACASSPPLTAA
jgi:hypothetical protein